MLYKTMNSKENSSYTTEMVDDLPDRKQTVPNEKILELLKLIYYERTSIKQASKYLKINYSSAKKVLKQFRRNKLPIEGKYEKEFEDILRNINRNGSKTMKDDEKTPKKKMEVERNVSSVECSGNEVMVMDSKTREACGEVSKKIKSLHMTLSELKKEIFMNQVKIQTLLGYTILMAEYNGKGR